MDPDDLRDGLHRGQEPLRDQSEGLTRDRLGKLFNIHHAIVCLSPGRSQVVQPLRVSPMPCLTDNEHDCRGRGHRGEEGNGIPLNFER